MRFIPLVLAVLVTSCVTATPGPPPPRCSDIAAQMIAAAATANQPMTLHQITPIGELVGFNDPAHSQLNLKFFVWVPAAAEQLVNKQGWVVGGACVASGDAGDVDVTYLTKTVVTAKEM